MTKTLLTLKIPAGAEAILHELLTVQVQFIVVGDLALQYYCPQRPARDLDVLIQAGEANAIGVADVLDRIGFQMKPETVRFLFVPGPKPQQISLHPAIPAHILTEGDGFDFMAHWEQGAWIETFSGPVRIASPQLLLAMKSRNLQERDAEDALLLQMQMAVITAS